MRTLLRPLLGAVIACLSQAGFAAYEVRVETIATVGTDPVFDHDLLQYIDGATSAAVESHDASLLHFDDETASANLATGELKAFHHAGTIALASPPSNESASGFARALMRDTLYLTVAGAAPDTVTPVSFSFVSEGLVLGDDPALTMTFSGALGNAFFAAQYQQNAMTSGFGGWADFAFDSLEPGLVSGTGTINVIGSQLEVPFWMELFVGGNFGLLDFSHTAYTGISLPANVTLTSASGVFLTEAPDHNAPSAVPEPSAWAMMLLGFGAIGGGLRFQKRRNIALGNK
jgi:hypothetical protein